MLQIYAAHSIKQLNACLNSSTVFQCIIDIVYMSCVGFDLFLLWLDLWSNKTMVQLENKPTADRILMLLKMRGDMTSAMLAQELSITKEGARQQLLKLESSGLIKGTSKSEGVGRPVVYYALSEKGLSRFPDTHAQITVELLRSVKSLLGENALNLLISDREKQTFERYDHELKGERSIEGRLNKLAELRSQEGYMAEWKKENDEYLLIENHCPICAAATECQGFCKAELKNFQDLMGSNYQVERIKHIISDGQRCVYSIRAKGKPASD